MGKILRVIAALGVAIGFGLGAAPAFAEEELIGIFKTPDGGQDFRVSMCGDGTQLCVQLVALHDHDDKPKNRKWLGTYIINEFPPTGTNKWRGSVRIREEMVVGDVILTPGKELYVKACAYIFVCADITLHYAGT